MVKIKIASNAGFCFGVQRAVDIAFKLGSQYPGQVFTLGPIIHNSNVVEQLEKMSNDYKQFKEFLKRKFQ